MKVVDNEGKPVPNLEIKQGWRYIGFESQNHEESSVSDSSGDVKFSKRRIWVSFVSFILSKIFRNTVGLLFIHNDSGPYNFFWSEEYVLENRWCYPKSRCYKRETVKEIVIKGKNPK